MYKCLGMESTAPTSPLITSIEKRGVAWVDQSVLSVPRTPPTKPRSCIRYVHTLRRSTCFHTFSPSSLFVFCFSVLFVCLSSRSSVCLSARIQKCTDTSDTLRRRYTCFLSLSVCISSPSPVCPSAHLSVCSYSHTDAQCNYTHFVVNPSMWCAHYLYLSPLFFCPPVCLSVLVYRCTSTHFIITRDSLSPPPSLSYLFSLLSHSLFLWSPVCPLALLSVCLSLRLCASLSLSPHPLSLSHDGWM